MGRPATLRVDIVADARKVGSGVRDAESSLGRLGSVGRKAGLAVAGGLAVGTAAAGKFALDSIKSASDVQQAYGALDTVYGKSSASVKRWAEGAADSVGLAKSEYANLSALVGSQLQGMGMHQDKSAKKSNELIKLGADLAATYGGSVNDAVSAVSSTLKGETDPIERYGVSIKQADVNARLAAMGLDGLTGKAAKQAQAQAVLGLLTEQTAKATGAFGRESNTLAGQQERLKAKFENLKATVGAKLLPVVTRLFTWFNDKLLPAAGRLGRWLQANLGPAFAAVGRFIRDKAVPAARELVHWYVEKIAPGLKRSVAPVLAGIRSAFAKVTDAVRRNKPELLQLFNALKKVAEFMANKVYPIVGKMLGRAFSTLGDSIGDIIGIVGWFTRSISNAIDKVRSLIGWIQNIHMPKLDLPSWAGGAVGNLVTVGPQLVGSAPSYDNRRSWSTAALATGATSTSGQLRTVSASSSTLSAGSYVDARTFVTVDGALDPVRTADQIAELLDRRSRRLGQR